MRYTFTSLARPNTLDRPYWMVSHPDTNHIGAGRTKFAAVRDLEEAIEFANTFDNDPLVMRAAVKTFIAMSPRSITV